MEFVCLYVHKRKKKVRSRHVVEKCILPEPTDPMTRTTPLAQRIFRTKESVECMKTDPFVYSDTELFRSTTEWPEDLVFDDKDVLGKGANNRIVKAKWKNRDCVLRIPRRGSDTQTKGNAMWEFCHTLRAGQLGASPAVYHAWHARHATDEYPSGLYLICEVMQSTMEDWMTSRRCRDAAALGDDGGLADSVVECLTVLANAGIFVYDLKPANVLVNVDASGRVRAKIIDFGRDFCEWSGPHDARPDAHTPVIDMLRKTVKNRSNEEEKEDVLVKHVLFGAMLVQLSCCTTKFLHMDRREHRMSQEERASVNPLAKTCDAFLNSMRGSHIQLLRRVLRADSVRSVLAHYNGRRRAGTRRTLRYARGGEM